MGNSSFREYTGPVWEQKVNWSGGCCLSPTKEMFVDARESPYSLFVTDLERASKGKGCSVTMTFLKLCA